MSVRGYEGSVIDFRGPAKHQGESALQNLTDVGGGKLESPRARGHFSASTFPANTAAGKIASATSATALPLLVSTAAYPLMLSQFLHLQMSHLLELGRHTCTHVHVYTHIHTY